ncbi:MULTISPECIES: DUF6478 family protein [unclassified Ruegeria]|uniref:DUF6478 family protein n=1 Tax=unclassified Ruegeria TaxID=2625375 RepID=UPI001ADABC46|nr:MULTISPECIES: DUF6478 family protein [unclassified Ruegeria]MBO9412417.1 hypothetical protein [Ruegeria sp. R8_1]MBO9416345.1 hypothetical protein [Ruegeria sp. R8_2]
MGKLLDRYIHQRVLARWRQAAQDASATKTLQLRKQRDEARKLRFHLDSLISQADNRLRWPSVGSEQFPKPLGTDWSWRPDLWRRPLPRRGVASAPRKAELDGQVTLFHDCALCEIAARQIRNTKDKDLAPFGLSTEVFAFSGSFLSVSVELPPEATRNLTKEHLFRVDLSLRTEREISAMTRLNIQHGPNTDQVLRGLERCDTSHAIDFDLAHLPLNEQRIQKVWLDVIFDRPSMNSVVLHDLTFCRHHRADL